MIGEEDSDFELARKQMKLVFDQSKYATLKTPQQDENSLQSHWKTAIAKNKPKIGPCEIGFLL